MRSVNQGLTSHDMMLMTIVRMIMAAPLMIPAAKEANSTIKKTNPTSIPMVTVDAKKSLPLITVSLLGPDYIGKEFALSTRLSLIFSAVCPIMENPMRGGGPSAAAVSIPAPR